MLYIHNVNGMIRIARNRHKDKQNSETIMKGNKRRVGSFSVRYVDADFNTVVPRPVL